MKETKGIGVNGTHRPMAKCRNQASLKINCRKLEKVTRNRRFLKVLIFHQLWQHSERAVKSTKQLVH
jgi:hypothetical protein